MIPGAEEFLSDPEAIATVQNFLYGVSQNCVVGAITEWKNRRDDARAQRTAELLSSTERSKSLTGRIANKITLSLQQLHISKHEFALLLPAASDQVLAAELAQQIASDSYSAEKVAEILFCGQEPASKATLLRLAGSLVSGIQAAIAEDPDLHRLKELYFQGRTTETLADMRAEFRADMQTQSQGLADLRQEMALITQHIKVPIADAYAGAEHLKTLNQKRFDRARYQLTTGSLLTAEREYRALVADLEEQGALADITLLFRSYTNLGSSLWQQFRRDEAVAWFDKACQTKPDEPKARTNRALCHIHRKEYDEAKKILQEIKAAEPANFDPVYLIATMYQQQGDAGAAVRVLEEKCFETEDYYFVLAEAYIRNSDFKKAEAAARRALSIHPDSAEAHVALANSLAFPLVHRRMRGDPGSLSLSESDWATAEEAVFHAQAAEANLKKKARHFQRAELLTNLSAFYKLLEDDEKAARAASDADAISPANPTTLSNLWAAQMCLGKYSEAAQTAGRLIPLDGVGGSKWRLKQLESLLMNSEAERVLKECDEDPGLIAEFRKDPRYFEIKSQAFVDLHQSDQALSVLEEGFLNFPADPRLLIARAEIAEGTGQFESAWQDLERAEKAAPPESSLPTLAQAAMFLYRRKDWKGGEARLRKLGANQIRSPLLGPYLTCLYNSGNYPECFALASKAIKTAQSFNSIHYELAARSAYHCDDLTNAARLLELLVRKNTGDVLEHERMLAQVFLRLDEAGKAFDVLKRAHARAPKDISVLIGLSHVQTIRKHYKDAMAHAITAVGSAPDDVRAHLAVFKAGIEIPEQVKPDSSQIKAFQESLAFLQKHPSGFVKAIPFESDLKSFISFAKSRAKHAKRVEDLVRTKHLPMGILSHQLGVSPFRTWTCLVGHPKLHVQMAYGTPEEQKRELDAARAAAEICVDVYSLFTLRLLRLLDLVPKLFTKIIAHTSTLEAIVADIQAIENKQSMHTIIYQGGVLARSDVSAEEIQGWRSALQEIRDFLKSDAVELTSLEAATILTKDMSQAREILGAVDYDPLLLANSKKATFYGDDAAMRSLAWTTRTATFCSQALLRLAREKGLLSALQYEDCVITLLRHNYHFVSETTDTLVRLAKVEGFAISALSKLLLSRATSPGVDQATSVRIIAEFFLELWRTDFSQAKSPRGEWLDLCIDTLIKTKEPEKLFAQFLANVALRALPYPNVFGGIVIWILKSGRLAAPERALFFLIAQKVALQMGVLALQEFPWSPAIRKGWHEVHRIGDMLVRNGWLL